MIETTQFEDVEKTISLMREIPTLHALDGQHLEKLIHFSSLRKYQPSEVIIQEGARDFQIYFLISGRVNVIKQGVRIGDFRRSGDIFGEMCLIDRGERSASVVAHCPCLCLAINAEFLDGLDNDSKLVFQMLLHRVFSEILAQRLRKMNNEIIYLRNIIGGKCPPPGQPRDA